MVQHFQYSKTHLVHVWIALKRKADAPLRFLCGSHALFTGPANTFFSKNNFKTKSHGIIHTFKNYFATMFSLFNFQFSAINGIQIDPYKLADLRNRLSTCDRFLSLRYQGNSLCVFCGGYIQSRDHLFIECNFIIRIWHHIEGNLGTTFFNKLSVLQRKKGLKSVTRKVAWALALYNGVTKSKESLYQAIKWDAKIRTF